MAFNFGNLGDGNGYIYKVYPTGDIDTFENNQETLRKIKIDAVMSRAMALPKFQNGGYSALPYGSGTNDLGDRYYLNAEVAAPFGSTVGAVEVSRDIIPWYNTAFTGVQIVSDELPIERLGDITLVALTPEAGNTDTIDDIISPAGVTIPRVFLPSDILILSALNGAGDSFTIRDESVSGGTIRLSNQTPCYLYGYNSLVLIKDSTGWRELTRSNDTILDVATEQAVAAGGTWTLFDTSLAAGKYLRTRNGVAIIDASANPTLVANFTVQAESPITERSVAQSITVIQKGEIILNGNTMGVMGVTIPEELALSGKYMVQAWYDPIIADYRAHLVLIDESFNYTDFSTVSTVNAVNVTSDTVHALRVIDNNSDFHGVLNFGGTITLATAKAHAAGALSLFTAITNRWRPSTYDQRFICEVTTAGNVGTKICVIEVTAAGVMNAYAIAGFNLAAGDIINVTPVKYVAGY